MAKHDTETAIFYKIPTELNKTVFLTWKSLQRYVSCFYVPEELNRFR